MESADAVWLVDRRVAPISLTLISLALISLSLISLGRITR